jgi:hypothetical protein
MRVILDLKRAGGKVVVINPMRELGLVRFKVPSDPISLLLGTRIADEYVMPHIGGDIALLTGMLKATLAFGNEDREYIAASTEGFDAARTVAMNTSWDDIEAISGVSRQLTIVGGRQPITFNVPASIKDGAKLRLPATASRPEIIATVHITNPYGFDRKEDNLIVDVSVPFTTCAIGGEITAVTPSGERKTLRLPAGTQGGQQLRITGHGMTKGAGNPRGDMLVRIKIEVPKNLTDRQRAALDELAAALEDGK